MAMQLFTILIVDSDSNNRKIIATTLANDGCLIFNADSSEEAVKIASENKIDMIILDYETSKFGGNDFIQIQFKKHETPNIPVYMMSNSVSLQTKLVSFMSGAIRFFPKPVDLDELVKSRINLRLIGFSCISRKGRIQESIATAKHPRRFPGYFAKSIGEDVKLNLTDSLGRSMILSDQDLATTVS